MCEGTNHSDYETVGVEKANDDLPQRSLHQERASLFPRFFIFTKLSQRLKILFFYHASDFASTQRIRSIIASKVARRAGGEGAPLSPASISGRANLRDRDFYRRRSCIDLSGCQVGEDCTSRSKPRAIMKRDFRSVLMRKEVIHQL